MLGIYLITLFIASVCCSQVSPGANTTKNFIYNTYNYSQIVNVWVNDNTEQIMDFNEADEACRGCPTRVHISTNNSLNVEHPLFITAEQQRAVTSWSLPLVVKTNHWAVVFTDMARTLCPHDAGPNMTENRPTMHLTTSNPQNVSVAIQLRRVTDFYVEVNKEVALNVTPSTPKYYYFSFDQNPWNVTDYTLLPGIRPSFNYTIPKSVILMIDSDDDVCATVSIQNNSCPVFDNEKEILYQGYHLTMTTKGGITLTQAKFPNGFYVVFVVKRSDDECTGVKETEELGTTPSTGIRRKGFRFRIKATVSYKEYVVAALVTLAVVGLVVLLVLAALLPCRCRCTEEVIVVEDLVTPSTSGMSQRLAGEGDELLSDQETIIKADADRETRAYVLTVEHLCRSPPEQLARRADRYFWGALTIAVVYALPVVQLLYTYQQMVVQTGNQDLCYYNFLCAHPLGSLSDFNHVYSNVGYVLLGLAFVLQVRLRQRNCPVDQGMGIPQHFGLLYSMGLGLAMEGVLSACYHLCPNKMNFQFDSSFMYVIAVLSMIKLYQNRHSDIIPSAHSTFMLLAVIMAIGLFGILFPSLWFSVLFTVLHLSTCLVLTLKIYYAGNFRLERAAVCRAWGAVWGAVWGPGGPGGGGRSARRPRHPARAVLLALANLANWSFALYSVVEHNKDFARLLLAILMGNAILYTVFYVAMKLLHRERLPAHCWLYAALAALAWAAAGTLFTHSTSKWAETPAQSRRHNAECSSLRFYDQHDLWHVTSAAAMFLSLNMILTLDDHLKDTPRDHLPTF